MFIGHFAAGMAAKRFAPKTSLGTLFLSVQLLDLIWPAFVLAGIERVGVDPGNTAFTPLDFEHYPFTHSLVGVTGWSLALGLAYFAARRQARAAWIVGAGVMSHWALDALAHRPDLPVLPSGPFVGMGLWNSVPATLTVELALFAVGVAIYVRATPARNRVGSYAFWALVGFLLVLYFANAMGPPPPSPRAVAVAGLAM